MLRRALAAVFLVSLLLPLCAAQSLKISRVEKAPRLEDFLDGEPPWEPAVTQMVQRDPSEGRPASQDTEIYLAYDSRNLYVVFRCNDREPHKIRARLNKRDDVSDDDFVAIRLDTFRDRRRAYLFASTPQGIQADAIHEEGRGVDHTFDTLWYSRARLTGSGYVVWMAIPFKSVRFSENENQNWGILFTRGIPRNNEFAYWPPVSRRIQGFLTQAAELDGLDDISPGRNIQFIPYGTFFSSRFADLSQRQFFSKRADGDFGLDTKVVLNRNLVLDVTLNPDFSQVESDEPQVTVNQRYEVFFPEKRPFFLENANFFQTPIQVFFTRRVIEPQFGARLTGKQGRYAIGALVADDQAPGRSTDPALEGRRAIFSAIRVNRDIARESTVGGVFVERRFGNTFNRVAGADTRIQLPGQVFLQAQVLGSFTGGPGARTSTGAAIYAGIEHYGRHWSVVANYTDLDPEFRADAGFVPRVDMRRTYNYVACNARPTARRLVRWGPDLLYQATWTYHDGREDWYWRPAINFEWRGQTLFIAGLQVGRERFRTSDFSRTMGFAYFRTAASKRLTAINFTRYGRSIVYAPAGGRPAFQSNTFASENTLTFRPIAPLRLDETVLYTHLNDLDGTRAFNNVILRQKVNWQFNRALSLRAIAQYESTLPNALVSALERTKRFSGDVLLSYVLHPGTAVYLGYAHHLQNIDAGLGRDPLGPPLRNSALFPTGRQFFAKISYLYRF